MKHNIINVKKEEQERHLKYAAIMGRATVMGLMKEDEDIDRMMDIESADIKFNLRLDDWLEADNFNFAHDFLGIRDSINREKGFPAKDFGLFVPRFARLNRNLTEEGEDYEKRQAMEKTGNFYSGRNAKH